MTASASVKLVVNATLSKAFDLMSAAPTLQKSFSSALANGAAANQIDRVWHDKRTIAISGNEDLDLSGALVDIFGDPFVLARIKGLFVFPSSANTNNVDVSRPAANGVPIFVAAGDKVSLVPGGLLVLLNPSAAGYVVTAGTGDLLNIANSAAGTSVDYDIVLFGSST